MVAVKKALDVFANGVASLIHAVSILPVASIVKDLRAANIFKRRLHVSGTDGTTLTNIVALIISVVPMQIECLGSSSSPSGSVWVKEAPGTMPKTDRSFWSSKGVNLAVDPGSRWGLLSRHNYRPEQQIDMLNTGLTFV